MHIDRGGAAAARSPCGCVEAERPILQAREAAHEQSGADEQEHRQRNLRRDDDRAARDGCGDRPSRRGSLRAVTPTTRQPAAAAGVTPNSTPTAIVGTPSPGARVRRSSRPGVPGDRGLCSRVARSTGRSLCAPRRNHQPAGRTEPREHESFGQVLSKEIEPARAERQADGRLALPACLAHEDQARHVRHRDEQQHDTPSPAAPRGADARRRRRSRAGDAPTREKPACVSGCSRARRSATARSSTSARSRVTPSRRRATTR